MYYYFMYIEREDITTHMLHVFKIYFDRIFRGQWLNARTRNSRSRTEGTDFHQTSPSLRIFVWKLSRVFAEISQIVGLSLGSRLYEPRNPPQSQWDPLRPKIWRLFRVSVQRPIILPCIRAQFSFKLGHANFPTCIKCLHTTLYLTPWRNMHFLPL